MRRRSFLAAAGAAAAITRTRVARGAPQPLTFSSWLPARHPLMREVFPAWMAAVAAATEGRVAVELLPEPAGPPGAHYDLAREGRVDLAVGLYAFLPGERFPAQRATEFAFLADSGAVLSRAHWTVYRELLAPLGEHDGTEVLALMNHGPGCLHLAGAPPAAADGLAGRRLRSPGGHCSRLLQRLGAEPVPLGAGEIHAALAEGRIEGAAITLEALVAYRLGDFVRHTVAIPGGLYNTAWFLVVNEAAWQRLGEADREAIMAVSGATLSERCGAVWDEADAAARAPAEAAGVAIAPAAAPFLAALRPAEAELEAAWIAEMASRGLDGAAVLARLRSLTGASGPG